MEHEQSLVSRRAVLGASVGVAALVMLEGCTSRSGGAQNPSAGASSSGQPKRGGTVRLAVSDAGPDPLDPLAANHLWTHIYALLMWDTLTTIDSSWRVSPQLAESWEANADVTKWTFKLRQGIKFHNGKAFTSADAAYTLKRTLDKALGSGGYARLSSSLTPSGIETPDDHTLVLNLKQPDSLLPAALAQPYNAVVPTGFDPKQATGIGTGPFKLKSWQVGQKFEVVRNDAYWNKGLPYLDGVRGVVMPQESTKVQAVNAGQQDLCDPVSFAAARTISGQGDVVVAANGQFFTISMDSTQAPFTDPRVARAIKLAVDRDTILTAAAGGQGSTTQDVPVPQSDPYYPTNLKPPASAQIAEAKRLLAEAGHPNGIDVTLHTFDGAAGMVDTATAFAAIVKAAGVRVNVQVDPAATYYEKTWLIAPMFMAPWGTRLPYDMITVAYKTDAPWNETRFKSSALDSLLAKTAATTDGALQKRYIGGALDIISRGASNSIPIFVDSPWPKNKRLQGVDVTPRLRYDILTSAYFD